MPPDNTRRVFPLPSGEYGAWIAQARRLHVFVCDAVFWIEPSFYIGPDDGMTSLEWETANVRLPPLDLPRQLADRVTTAELLGREDALISHYRRLVEVAEMHSKTASLRPFPYFRTQPAIITSDEVLTEFSGTMIYMKRKRSLRCWPNPVAALPAYSMTIRIRAGTS